MHKVIKAKQFNYAATGKKRTMLQLVVQTGKILQIAIKIVLQLSVQTFNPTSIYHHQR